MPRPRPLLLALFALAACSRAEPTAREPSATAPGGKTEKSDKAEKPATAPKANTIDDKEYDKSVRPVYPTANVAAHPLAARLCEVLHDLPRARHAECCSQKPGVVLTSECVRNLSGALATKAVRLVEAEVAACEAAMRSAYQSCDWVGPWSPPLPEVCAGILHGAMKTGEKCRSSLECEDGLRCLGAGPTDAGICGPPQDAGRLCGTAVDTLAVYARQDDFELLHPACKGYCDRNRCTDTRPTGAACSINAECGRGNRCDAGKCVSGAKAKEGAACLGGDCASGLRCVANECIAPKPLGAACSSDTECLAACEIPEGKESGVCGKRCSELPVIRKKLEFPLPAHRQ